MRLIVVLLMICFCALAQVDQARIVGTVVDTTGAVIPNASVSIKDNKTGKTREVTADSKGFYVVAGLSPTVYTMVAKGNGLGPAEYTEITLSIGQERTINIILQPAALTTEVTVSGGELTVVDTSSASIGANVNQREVGNLPLNGR